MGDYLLDTNHAIAYMEDERDLRLRVRRAVGDGDRLALPSTALAELFFGAFASRQRQTSLENVEQLRSQVDVVAFGVAAAREYGKIMAELKARGRPVGEADAHIAAVARTEGMVLLTADKHFDLIDGLEVENWLDIEDNQV